MIAISDLVYQIYEDYIDFIKYPFKCSSVYKNSRLNSKDIIEVAENFLPPTIKTKNNELIMISAVDKEKLFLFCAKNSIPICNRVDIWELILEPFLDTEFSEQYIQSSNEKLIKHGVSIDECNNIRQEVTERMIAYNFKSGLWDWCHLGLLDVLYASCGHLSGKKYCLKDTDFKNFYFRAMDIALKGF